MALAQEGAEGTLKQRVGAAMQMGAALLDFVNFSGIAGIRVS
jgi:hypothetical protein